jgi:hypothetical protein
VGHGKKCNLGEITWELERCNRWQIPHLGEGVFELVASNRNIASQSCVSVSYIGNISNPYQP